MFPILFKINKLFPSLLEINILFLKLPEKNELFNPKNNLFAGLIPLKNFGLIISSIVLFITFGLFAGTKVLL